MAKPISPNTCVQPLTASVNDSGHLTIDGMDVIELAEIYGTPLWIVDEKTILQSIAACKQGLADSAYPSTRVLYAGKAFLCLAMCHLITNNDVGLDVVSLGELETAISAHVPPNNIYLHGNNKSEEEIISALTYGQVRIVVDNKSELELVIKMAESLGKQAKVLLRVTPGVEPDTHQYIKTGQEGSKFGIPLTEIVDIAAHCLANRQSVDLLGLHAHIGSQSHNLGPYEEIVEIFADLYEKLKQELNIELSELDAGGGLGIAYTEDTKATAIYDWAKLLGESVKQAFEKRNLKLPILLVEPGRAIVGTAGVTLYKTGFVKTLPTGTCYVAVDGGMADNPRPVTYQARYTAMVANAMPAPRPDAPQTIVGKYCESGDIIVKDAYINAKPGDYIVVFGTGAYNYSMSSNYNRTAKPACILINNGEAEVIIERETTDDLMQKDRVPKRLLTNLTHVQKT
jgi:diaminopimelate decarboxylase